MMSSTHRFVRRLLLGVVGTAIIYGIAAQHRWLSFSDIYTDPEFAEQTETDSSTTRNGPFPRKAQIKQPQPPLQYPAQVEAAASSPHPTSTDNALMYNNDPAKKIHAKEFLPEDPTIPDTELVEYDTDRQEYRIRQSVDTPNVNTSTLCVPWEVNGDLWWTHHPDWEAGMENVSHYCFRQIKDSVKARYFQKLYSIQFGDDVSPHSTNHCDKLIVKKMWSSGWGADMMNLVDGLHHAYLTSSPVQIEESKPWHYAFTKKSVDSSKERKAACPQKNMYCYLLNMTNCKSGNQTGIDEPKLEDIRQLYDSDKYWWYIEFLVRPQTWLRKRVYDFLQQHGPQLQTPCTAMHVRRNDIVLHSQQARKFHPIGEYMNASNNIRPNILLLTDDHNALGEATTQFPQYNWIYIDRPRFQGVGGWEHQIPSDDPTFEVVVLFSTFQLVRSCDQIILSFGKFSDYLYAEMNRNRAEDTLPVDKVDIDKLADRESIMTGANANTHVISRKYEQDKPNLLGKKTITSGGEHIVGEPLARNKVLHGPFCLSWDVNADDWWTHHPTWEMGNDNETHFCFTPISNASKAALYKDIYRIQYQEGNCDNVFTKRIRSSGYGADLATIADGLVHALQTREPMQVGTEPWYYADLSVNHKDRTQSHAVACPKLTMFCYFLDLSRCHPKESWEGGTLENLANAKRKSEYRWFLQYVARPQTWLRKEIADFVRKQEQVYFKSPCAVLHARALKEHTIEEYLHYATQVNTVDVHNNILLLTDDQNVIHEAKAKFPHYTWMYIDRPRFRSEDANWEQHQRFPSNDPVFEMVVLQAIVRMARQCDQLLHATSHFAQMLQWEMESSGERAIVRVNIDEHRAE